MRAKHLLILALALGAAAGGAALAAPQPPLMQRGGSTGGNSTGKMIETASALRAKRQYQNAFQLYMAVINSGDSHYLSTAWNSLGYMYREGQLSGGPFVSGGNARDSRGYCYRMSATSPNPCKEGCLNYARCLRDGVGCSVDTAAARSYYQKAANLGSDDAVREMANLGGGGWGNSSGGWSNNGGWNSGGNHAKKLEQASALRARRQYRDAYYIYAEIVRSQDASCRSTAWNSLGYMYREGQLPNGPFIYGTSARESRYFCYMESATCSNPCKEGCLNYARCLRDGIACSVDIPAARLYYQKAIELGSDDAVRELARLPRIEYSANGQSPEAPMWQKYKRTEIVEKESWEPATGRQLDLAAVGVDESLLAPLRGKLNSAQLEEVRRFCAFYADRYPDKTRKVLEDIAHSPSSFTEYLGFADGREGVSPLDEYNRSSDPDKDTLIYADGDYLVSYRESKGTAVNYIYFWDTHTGRLIQTFQTSLLARGISRLPGSSHFVLLEAPQEDILYGAATQHVLSAGILADSVPEGEWSIARQFGSIATVVLNPETRGFRYVTERVNTAPGGTMLNVFNNTTGIMAPGQESKYCHAYLQLHSDTVQRMLKETGYTGDTPAWDSLAINTFTPEPDTPSKHWRHSSEPAEELTRFPMVLRQAVLRPISKKASAFRVQNGPQFTDGFSLDLADLRREAPYYTSPKEKPSTGMFLPPADIKPDAAARKKIKELMDREYGNPLAMGTHCGWNIYMREVPEGDDIVPAVVYLLSPQGKLTDLASFDPECGGDYYSAVLNPTVWSYDDTKAWDEWKRGLGSIYLDLVQKDGALYMLQFQVGSYIHSMPEFRIIELRQGARKGYRIVCEQAVDMGKPPFWDLDRGLIVLPQGGRYVIYRLRDDMQLDKVADLILQGEHYAIVLPDGRYAGSPGCESILQWSDGDRRCDLSPLAPWRNRPHEVLAALGGDPAEVQALKATLERWLAKQGVDTSEPEPRPADLPELKVEYPDVAATGGSVTVLFTARAHASDITAVQVRADGVELPAIETRIPAGQSRELSVGIPLIPGCNMLELCAVDAKGRHGTRERFRVVKSGSATPVQYVVAVGVSDYDQAELQLHFAAKDAQDIAAAFKGAGSKVLLLTDKEVAKDTCVEEIRRFLADAAPQDHVIFYCAGHGLLGDNYEYYFAPHDFDPDHIEDSGVPMDALISAVKSSPARRRLMLVDTCHAGSVGEADEEKLAALQGSLPSGVRAVRTRGMRVTQAAQLTGQARRRFIEDIFTSGSAERGVTVFTASAGSQFAYESDKWKNGVFAHTILEALGNPSAVDPAGKGAISVAKLGDFLTRRVPEQTNGAQTPAINVYNAEQEFAIRPRKTSAK